MLESYADEIRSFGTRTVRPGEAGGYTGETFAVSGAL